MKDKVRHNEKEARFELTKDGNTAYIAYRMQPGIMDIYKTLIPQPMEGQGIGGVLMNGAIDYVRENRLTLNASCPFAKAYMLRRPELQES